MNRRKFGILAGSAFGAAAMSRSSNGASILSGSKPVQRNQLVIVGAGHAGRLAAEVFLRQSELFDVTLIEPDIRRANGISGSIPVIRSWVAKIDHDQHNLRLADGSVIAWDCLVMAPGLATRFETFPGYDFEVQSLMPHGFAAQQQFETLAAKLANLPQHGKVSLVLSSGIKPGLELITKRIEFMHHLLSKQKRSPELIILEGDNNPQWYQALQNKIGNACPSKFRSKVKWVSFAEHQGITGFEAGSGLIHTSAKPYNSDFASVIPRFKSADITHLSGLTNGDWMLVDHRTQSSLFHGDIYGIGSAIGETGAGVSLITQVQKILSSVSQKAALKS